MIQFNTFALSDLQGTPKRNGVSRLNIYSGTIPDVGTDFVFQASNYEAQLLAAFNVAMSDPSTNSSKLTFTSNPTFNAVGTGVASWFCLATAAGVGYILGTVSSDPASKGPLLIDNVNLAPSTNFPYSVVAFAVNFAA